MIRQLIGDNVFSSKTTFLTEVHTPMILHPAVY